MMIQQLEKRISKIESDLRARFGWAYEGPINSKIEVLEAQVKEYQEYIDEESKKYEKALSKLEESRVQTNNLIAENDRLKEERKENKKSKALRKFCEDYLNKGDTVYIFESKDFLFGICDILDLSKCVTTHRMNYD